MGERTHHHASAQSTTNLTTDLESMQRHQLRSPALLLAGLSLVGRSYAWNCYYDAYGNEVCDGLGYGARVGIAIAIIAILVAIVFLTFYTRRRRVQRYQQQYAQQRRPPSPSRPTTQPVALLTDSSSI